jgi:F0F1-type ATP synthase membrane subunit b/b'
MNGVDYGFAAAFVVFVVFCWIYYFRGDIRRWWDERGPRRELAREAARERQEEVQRLRDELASKYLSSDGRKPPRTPG